MSYWSLSSSLDLNSAHFACLSCYDLKEAFLSLSSLNWFLKHEVESSSNEMASEGEQDLISFCYAYGDGINCEAADDEIHKLKDQVSFRYSENDDDD